MNARSMSTQQFKQLYPAYYDDLQEEIEDDPTSSVANNTTLNSSKGLNSSKAKYQLEHARLTQLVNNSRIPNKPSPRHAISQNTSRHVYSK